MRSDKSKSVHKLQNIDNFTWIFNFDFCQINHSVIIPYLAFRARWRAVWTILCLYVCAYKYLFAFHCPHSIEYLLATKRERMITLLVPFYAIVLLLLHTSVINLLNFDCQTVDQTKYVARIFCFVTPFSASDHFVCVCVISSMNARVEYTN